MKASFITCLLLAICAPCLVFAQSKAAISTKKNINGRVVYESRIIELNGTEDINSILKEMGVLDETGSLIPGNEFQINVMPSEQNEESFDLEQPFKTLPPMAPIQPFEPTVETVAYLGVMAKNDLYRNMSCVQITEVVETSPAENKIHVGDLIYKIDDTSIATHTDLVEFIHSKKPGDEVKIYIYRYGKKKTLKLTLGEKKQEVYTPFRGMPDMSYFMSPDSILLISPFDNKKKCDSTKVCQPFSWQEEGFETKETPFLGVTPAEENASKGVKIGSVIEGSCAEKMGLLEGDIILELNGAAVSNFDDLKADVMAISPGSTVEVLIERDGKEKLLEGELGSKSSSTQDDFRIFHEFKGMDENGNLNYDFELDMNVEELEQHLEEMMRDFNNMMNEGANELQIMIDPYLSEEPGKINVGELSDSDILKIEGINPMLEQLQFSSFTFIPNNENQTVKISFETDARGDLEIALFDSNGSKVHVERRSSFSRIFGKTLSLGNYPKGEYVLLIKVGDNQFLKKITKE